MEGRRLVANLLIGEYEDVKAVNDILIERGIDVPIHVDAASGGFVAPFISPDLEWDFRCKQVVSINVSGHKVCRGSPLTSTDIALRY